MIDINNIVNTAIQQEINKAITNYVDAYMADVQQEHRRQIAALREEIEQLKQQRAVSPATGSDAVQSRPTVDFITDVVTLLKEHADVREAMQQLVRGEVEAAVDEAIGSHCNDYDHDEYDRIVSFVDEDLPADFPDFDEFVTKEDLSDAVLESVRETLENRVSVSLYLS